MQPRTSRRGFLRLAGATAAFTALGQIRSLPAPAATPAGGERFFDAEQRERLTQIVERLVFTGEAGAPTVRDTRCIDTLDALCRGLDPEVSGQLPLALQLFEWGPLVFDWTFTRFSRMTPEERDRSLESWRTSTLSLRRQAFTALRNLAFLGYWSQPETWPLIGYRGPLVAAKETA